MADADIAVNSPLWWIKRLDTKLASRRPRYDKLERYFSGDHPLPEGDQRCREMFKAFQRKARTNYMRLVAMSPAERMQLVGFRTGGSDTTEQNDTEAWDIWQANHLDADSSMTHQAALVFSDAYVIVGPGEGDGKERMPLITTEDPRQVIVEASPTNRREARAGMKTWVDDVDELRHAVLYLPNEVHYFQTKKGDHGKATPVWELEQDPATNTLGKVPIVRFVASPNLRGDGIGEFEDVLDIQDRINDTILNRLVIAKLQAYRQRWVTGIESEDEDGNEIDLPFIPGVDLLWAVDGENITFGEFAQVDLTPLLKAIEADVQAIVTLTGLPPHYVAGDIVNASADALAAAESRLVAKVRNHELQFGESWEQVMRLAFTYREQPDHIGPGAEVVWADPERKSVAQLSDAAVKQQTAGVPWRQRMELLGYTPGQISRMAADRADDAILAASLGPAPATGDTGGAAGA